MDPALAPGTDLARENADLRTRLDAAEERLRALAPAAEVGIWVWPDLSARRVYLDAAMRRIHGLDVDREWFDPEEVFAKIHPDDIAQVRATIAEIVAAGGPYVVEYRHLRDGTMATVDYARTFGEATLHEGRAPSLRGTTVLVNAEYRLTRERDRAYEALQRAVAAGAVQLWDWPSMSGGDVTLNGVLHRGAPRVEDEPNRSPWHAWVHPDDREAFAAALATVSHAPGAFEIEVRMTINDSPYRWQLVRGTSAESDGSSEGLQASGTLVDVDDRKRYAAKLERANERLTLVAEGTSSGIWDWPDTDADYIQFSSELRAYLGYGDEDVEESVRWAREAVHPSDLPQLVAAIERAHGGGGGFAAEFRIRRAGGAYRYVRAAGKASRVAGAVGRLRLTGALSDVHDRVTAERRMREANRQLEAFADLVAHDLGAPLRHVAAFARILDEDHGHDLGPQGREHLATIHRAVRQSSAMIADLHEYARTGTNDLAFEPIDLNTVCQEVRDQLTAQGRSAHVTWVIGSLPTVWADRTQMLMLFQNLLANAAKFSAGREDATVRVTRGETASDLCEVIVADNGVGFDPELNTHIFEAFGRGHGERDFEGTGIGLANVQRIVARHGGTRGGSGGGRRRSRISGVAPGELGRPPY